MHVLFCPTVRVIPVTAVAVVDKTELQPLNLGLDFGKARSGSFSKTLTCFRKKLLRGKYEIIKESK